jgi:hypothetical protein
VARSLDQLAARVDELKKSLDAVAAAPRRTDRPEAALADGAQPQLKGLEADLRKLRDALPDYDDAEVAFAEFQKATKSPGRRAEAEVYAFNAINRRPQHLTYLKKYVTYILGPPDPTPGDLERLERLLLNCRNAVRTNDIPAVEKLIQRVTEAAKKAVIPDSKLDEHRADDGWAKSLEELLSVNLTTIQEDEEALENHLRKIQAAFGEGQAAVDALPEGARISKHNHLLSQGRTRLQQLIQLLKVKRTLAYVGGCLARLPSSSKEQTDRSLAYVQAAQSALQELWGIPVGDLPAPVKSAVDRAVDATYTHVESRQAEIVKALSESQCRQIEESLKTVKSLKVEDSPRQTDCKRIQDEIKKAQGLLGKMQSETVAQKAVDHIGEMAKILQAHRMEQRRRYQTACLKKIDAAIKGLNELRFWDRVKSVFSSEQETNVIKIFNDSKMVEIEESLLEPEILKLYQQVIEKIFPWLSADGAIRLQKKLYEGRPNRMTLESF